MPNIDHNDSPPPSKEFLWNSLTYGLIPDEQETENVNSPLDLTPILGLSTDDFIQQLYILALNRPPDPQAIEHWRVALLNGMQREAIIYMICTSHEFGNRRPVAHIDTYRKVYEKYRIRERIKSLPVLRWFLAFAGIPRKLTATLHRLLVLQSQMDMLISEQSRSLQTISTEIKLLSSQQSTLQAKQNALQNALQTQQNTLQSQLETANQNIVKAHVKLDETRTAILDTVNQTKPLIYGQPGGVTVIKTKEFFIGIPSEEWRLALLLSQYGRFEIGTEVFFRSILREDMVVLDIGANLGIYTLHALAAGCHVYSYEPTPKVFKLLLDNIVINGFESTGRAHTYNLAVSEAEGEMGFAVYEELSGHNTFYPTGASDKTIQVKTVSLDHHLAHLSHIDVAKIDVEGAEHLVLNGMTGIIAKNPHLKIIMEFAPSHLKRAGIAPQKFIQQIRSLGLGIHLIEENSGEILGISDEDLCKVFSANLLLERS